MASVLSRKSLDPDTFGELAEFLRHSGSRIGYRAVKTGRDVTVQNIRITADNLKMQLALETILEQSDYESAPVKK